MCSRKSENRHLKKGLYPFWVYNTSTFVVAAGAAVHVGTVAEFRSRATVGHVSDEMCKSAQFRCFLSFQVNVHFFLQTCWMTFFFVSSEHISLDIWFPFVFVEVLAAVPGNEISRQIYSEIIFQWFENWIYINKRNPNQSVSNFQERIRTSESFECHQTIYWNLNVKLMFARTRCHSRHPAPTLRCGCVHISIQFISLVDDILFHFMPYGCVALSASSSPRCIIEILIFNLCATTFQTHPHTHTRLVCGALLRSASTVCVDDCDIYSIHRKYPAWAWSMDVRTCVRWISMAVTIDHASCTSMLTNAVYASRYQRET